MKKWLPLFKLSFFVLMTIFICVSIGNWIMLLFSLAECLLIFAGCSMLYYKAPKWAYALNVICLFVYAAQLFVYYFSGEFISKLMLENVNMIANLGNELIIYILTCIPITAVLFFPINQGVIPKNKWWVVALAVAGMLLLTVCKPMQPVSPYTAAIGGAVRNLKANYYQSLAASYEQEELYSLFYKKDIPAGAINVGINPDKQPMSVILMLTEGLSAEVLDVYNNHGRNLTPHLDTLYAKSLVFDNYYNHTAATFRGVRGQLYSSYQYQGGYQGGAGLGELDADTQRKMLATKLVSIVDILKNKAGYNTCYINPEPGDKNVVSYLYSLGVDTLVSGHYGHDKARTDKQIFEVLKNTVRYYKNQQEPFFIVCYNLGTHHGYDSPDLKYGDGANSYLNKFYNYDAAFGDFFKEMSQEGVFDNTLLVFSADHATYPSPEYKATFASSQWGFINKIPLFIYTDGIIPQKIDAEGRNSLDLTPTLLDILDVHKVDNYFLGTSLFRSNPKPYSRICALGDVFLSITDGSLAILDDGNEWVNRIRQYYEISVIK